MAKSKVDIKEKVQKEFPEFTAEVDGLSVSDLEKRLSTYAKQAEEIEDAKDADEGLADAKDRVAELSGPYKDAKKAVRAKSKYLIALIKDKGGA